MFHLIVFPWGLSRLVTRGRPNVQDMRWNCCTKPTSTNIFGNLDKYIQKFRQIHFAIGTNKFCFSRLVTRGRPDVQDMRWNRSTKPTAKHKIQIQIQSKVDPMYKTWDGILGQNQPQHTNTDTNADANTVKRTPNMQES